MYQRTITIKIHIHGLAIIVAYKDIRCTPPVCCLANTSNRHKLPELKLIVNNLFHPSCALLKLFQIRIVTPQSA